MKKREFPGHEASVSINSRVGRKKFLCEIDPIIKKFAGLSTRETSAAKRRFRVMRNMAQEMLIRGFYSEGSSTEEYFVKFFSEVYSGQ